MTAKLTDAANWILHHLTENECQHRFTEHFCQTHSHVFADQSMTRNKLLELRHVENTAGYIRWRDESHGQRLDLPVALHPSSSKSLSLPTWSDFASLWQQPTSHHSRISSSAPRRGDVIGHVFFVLLGRHDAYVSKWLIYQESSIEGIEQKMNWANRTFEIVVQMIDLEIFGVAECRWGQVVLPCKKIG